MGHDPSVSGDRQQRSTALRAIAAIACVLFALLLLVAGGVVVGLWVVQRAVQQELADLDAAIASLDASYAERPTPLDVSAAQLFEEFQADRDAAIGEYRNQLLRLGGTIVSADVAAITLTLDAGQSAAGRPQIVRALMNGAGADSEDDFDTNAPLRYQPGNPIEICGYVTAYEPAEVEGIAGDYLPNTLVIEGAYLPLDQVASGEAP